MGPSPLLGGVRVLPAFVLVCGSLQAQAIVAVPDAPGMAGAVSTQQTGFQQQTGSQQQTAAQAVSQGIEDAAKGTVRDKGPARISGTVLESNGDVVAGAQVTLTLLPPAGAPRDALPVDAGTEVSDDNGRFHFGTVRPGRFRLTARVPNRSPATFEGTLLQGENFEAPALRLSVNASESVNVVATREELAEAEVTEEEHQRLIGVLPNFFVTYDWNAPPLNMRQKFKLSTRNVIDPANFVIDAGIAGVEQAQNDYSGFGQGAGAYGKRYAALTGDLVVGTFLGGAIFPAIFHQDPRYFYKGTGTKWSRLVYALSTAVICRGDNGKWQPNYSGVLGDLAAGAVSNFWYPAVNRDGASLTLENGFINIAYDGIGNVVQEFVYKHLTPHVPTYSPAPMSGVLPTP